MDVNEVRNLIRDLLNSSTIQTKHYNITISKTNGESIVILKKKIKGEIDHMYDFSTIINNYSTDWCLCYDGCIIIKIS